MGEATGAPGRANPVLRRLPYAGLPVGLWAALTPFVLLGPDLNAQRSHEVADHVVPGVVLILVSVAMIVLDRLEVRVGTLPLVCGFTIALGGLWMTATHLPLVRGDAGVTGAVVAWHSTPGVVVLVLGLVWVVTSWADAGPEPASGPAGRAGRAGSA